MPGQMEGWKNGQTDPILQDPSSYHPGSHNFDSNNTKIDKKLYKNILIHYIGYETIKDSIYVKINSVNPLYFIFSKVNGTLKKLMEINI